MTAPAMSSGRAAPTSASSLTPRQWEVMRLLAEGLTQDEVGVVLGISRNTVRNHAHLAYRALGVDTATSSASLVAALQALGWVQVPLYEWRVL